MTKMKANAYCMVYGCLNNNRNTNLTFFTLPKDIERRQKWLTLIDREDLLQKEVLKRSSHLVCAAHFEESSMKILKHLKDDALPTLLLRKQSQEGSTSSEAQSTSVQVEGNDKGKEIILLNNKEYVNVETQTESLQLKEEMTQTSNSLSKGTPKKRKLSGRECKLKRRKLDKKITKIKNAEEK